MTTPNNCICGHESYNHTPRFSFFIGVIKVSALKCNFCKCDKYKANKNIFITSPYQIDENYGLNKDQ